jgi:protein-S-isoprenylcysteine O-methyltransferase Ste14
MGMLGGAGLIQYWRPLALRLGPLEPYTIGLYAALFMMGIVLGSWGFLSLRTGGTNVDPLEPTLRLIIHGPYRFTRNPMYLAQLLVMLGFTALARSWWFLGAVPVLAILLNYLVIIPEERYLNGLFGETYTDYCQRVRRWV